MGQADPFYEYLRKLLQDPKTACEYLFKWHANGQHIPKEFGSLSVTGPGGLTMREMAYHASAALEGLDLTDESGPEEQFVSYLNTKYGCAFYTAMTAPRYGLRLLEANSVN